MPVTRVSMIGQGAAGGSSRDDRGAAAVERDYSQHEAEPAAQSELLTLVLRIVHRGEASFLFRQAGLKPNAADAGSITLIQRSGSAKNLNIHLHCLMLHGVYRHTEDQPIFDAAAAPTGDELPGLHDKIIARWSDMQRPCVDH